MTGQIGAVILAAGQSRRMGKPKMLLPWGKYTIIGQVVLTLYQAEKDLQTVIVAGKLMGEIQAAVLFGYPVKVVSNPDYEQGEMLSSLKRGLQALMRRDVDAALVVLGDQPQIQTQVVRKVIEAYRESGAKLVVPSYHMHRGHPWLVDHSLWDELLNLRPEETLRDYLNRCADDIHYVDVDTPTILKDLDTPEDYQAEKPS